MHVPAVPSPKIDCRMTGVDCAKDPIRQIPNVAARVTSQSRHSQCNPKPCRFENPGECVCCHLILVVRLNAWGEPKKGNSETDE